MAVDDELMEHVPPGWSVWGSLPPTRAPLEMTSADGAHTIRVERTKDGYVGSATIAGDQLGIAAREPDVIRAWVFGVLEKMR